MMYVDMASGLMTIGTAVPKVSGMGCKYMRTHTHTHTHAEQRYFISLLSFQNEESRPEIKTHNLK
jgi:hypothetical protein